MKYFASKLKLALECIHKCGFVHRDIRPSNLIIDINTNEPYIIDFGNADYINPNPTHLSTLLHYCSNNILEQIIKSTNVCKFNYFY